MKIAMTGSTGLVGTALSSTLSASGHDLVRLVRREPTGPEEAQWDIEAGTIDAEALEDIDAIIHLAGENIGQRWTDAVRKRVLDSRVNGTRLIAETAARLPRNPALLCASATGFYGNRANDEVDESSARGDGFLSDVVDQWEAAADPARAAGIRTVHLRQGIVLARQGGALQRLLLPFKLGVGGKVGSGKQWWSWVSLDDTVAAYLFALEHPLEGAVNVTAPGATTNLEFTKALGRALHRPTVLPLPAFAVKAAFGQMGREMLLEGQRVAPTKIVTAGFAFNQPDIDSGLASALAHSSGSSE
ncbi:TIGR01777 family oxidoreductase [Gaiella sp.]|uniref:TIGR01777 family oxidoreductase n=1 Tax=Gaiella sp. TaxID=2663207 RepID=UPI0039839CD1